MSELAVQVPRVTQQRATLLDLLDRVLGKGVVAYGDIVLSIADLDLVYLNLRAVLSSIGTLEKDSGSWFVDGGSNHQPPTTNHQPLLFPGDAPEPGEESKNGDSSFVIRDSKDDPRSTNHEPQAADGAPSSHQPPASDPRAGGKLELDPQKTAQGLAKLAMTLINLLRKLMERQAIRRMEAGTVNPEQLERAGQAFQRLDDQIKELCKQFGLKEEDLNLDLGPLGKVV